MVNGEPKFCESRVYSARARGRAHVCVGEVGEVCEVDDVGETPRVWPGVGRDRPPRGAAKGNLPREIQQALFGLYYSVGFFFFCLVCSQTLVLLVGAQHPYIDYVVVCVGSKKRQPQLASFFFPIIFPLPSFRVKHRPFAPVAPSFVFLLLFRLLTSHLASQNLSQGVTKGGVETESCDLLDKRACQTGHGEAVVTFPFLTYAKAARTLCATSLSKGRGVFFFVVAEEPLHQSTLPPLMNCTRVCLDRAKRVPKQVFAQALLNIFRQRLNIKQEENQFGQVWKKHVDSKGKTTRLA